MNQPSVDELRSRLSYDSESGFLFWMAGEKFSGKRAFRHTNKRGYCSTTFRSKVSGAISTLSAHKVAWAIHYGEYPSGQIDHINGIRTDNRINNLRDVINAENAKNMAMNSNNTSGVVGVYMHSQTGKWVAQINAFGRSISLGCFESIADATIARKSAERVLSYHENHGRRRP